MIEGTVSQDFFPLVFSMYHLPPSPENNIRVISSFFRKIYEIFACQGAPPVPLTLLIPVANLPPASYDTSGKFATGVSLNNIRLLTPYIELEEKGLSTCIC